MLESALVLLTVVGMLIFIMDIGRMLLIQQYAAARTRIAARQAVVSNWTLAEVQNYVAYGQTSDPGGGSGAGTGVGFLGMLPSQVTYTTLGTSGTPDYRLQVKVSGIPVLTWIPFISGRYTLPTILATVPAQSLGATD